MKSGNKYITSGIFVVLLLVFFINDVYAITGSIGNARMVLRPELGDKIEKSILVKNINDVPVNIELSVLGDLEKYIIIKDNNFVLQPGDERKAFFVIDVQKGGTTETKINVKFSPIDGGNGVGLSSTIVIIVDEEDSWNLLSLFDNNNEENNSVSVGQKNPDNLDDNKNKSNMLIFASSISTFTLFLVLLILVFLASKHIKKKRENKIKKNSRYE